MMFVPPDIPQYLSDILFSISFVKHLSEYDERATTKTKASREVTKLEISPAGRAGAVSYL